MKIAVKQQHVEVRSSLIDNIHRHIAADLKRFDHTIRRVCVQITGRNGPRGGEDKRCRIQVYMKRAAAVVVEDRGVSILAVVGGAVARVELAMLRTAGRIVELRRSKVRASTNSASAA